MRDISINGKSWIANLQKTEREKTGISSLKVGFNNVFGYYIEITNTHKDKMPDRYIRRQTMTNAERFITPELKEYEEKILHAEEKILSLETKLFNELRMEIASHAESIQRNAQLIAMLDCFVSLADVAVEYGYNKPEINNKTRIEIQEGRHPVIERLLPPGEPYTPNNLMIDNDENQIMIITGPNMSGKSSYLRQAGLITLLAQIGSFVPATKATIGIVDRIYTRVGASDNIASGESTFLKLGLHVAARVALNLERVEQRLFRPEKTHRQQNELRRQYFLRARHILRNELPLVILLPLNLHRMHSLDPAMVVADKLGRGF